MSIITKASAKNYFLTGNYPSQSQYGDTIDSYLGLGETALQTIAGPIAVSGASNFYGGITVSGATLKAAAFEGLGAAIIDDGAGNLTIGANKVTTAMIAANAVGASQLATTAVSAGSYTTTNLTIGADGRITAASNGSSFSASPITNSLGSDVALNNTSNYFDGPSVAQGSTGTWFASGKVTLNDPAGKVVWNVKLWDGTTVIDSTSGVNVATNQQLVVSLSGFKVSPAGNLRISVQDVGSTTGVIQANQSGNGKDSTITAYRIA